MIRQCGTALEKTYKIIKISHILKEFQKFQEKSEHQILELTNPLVDDSGCAEFKSGVLFSVRQVVSEVRQLLFFQFQNFDSSVQSAFSLFGR